MTAMDAKETNLLSWTAFAVVLVVGVVLLVAALAAPYGAGWGMMGWGMGWGAVFMVVPLLVLVLLLVLALGAFRPREHVPLYAPPPPSAATALETLNVRYARGEISREEYQRIRADLEGRAP